ncbi:MAG: alkaline phosphatase family protein [Planctomycetota bacterium]|jgi:arylsulfatase A-like enzyme
MYRAFTVCVLLLLSAACTIPLSSGEPGENPGSAVIGQKTCKNAILISWDGVQRNHLKECLYRKELPNLAALAEEGTITEIYLSTKTDTKCGHTVMLTGYVPEITGVFSNKVFRPIPEGYTILERAEKHFGTENIVTLMLTGKANHVGSKGPGVEGTKKKLRGVDGTEGLKHEGQPYHLTKKNIDVWDGDIARPATQVGPKTIKYLEQYKNMDSDKRFLFFFHFSDPDHAGHAHGENSKEYNDAIITCDNWLGKIVEKLKELELYDETAIFVNSDHGFDEGGYGHNQAPYVFLATNACKNLRWGMQFDVGPTVLDVLGIDSAKFEPPLSGTPLTKQRSSWTPLVSEPPEQKQKPKPKKKNQQQKRRQSAGTKKRNAQPEDTPK